MFFSSLGFPRRTAMLRFSRQHSYLSLNPLGMIFLSAGVFFIMDVAQSKLSDFYT